MPPFTLASRTSTAAAAGARRQTWQDWLQILRLNWVPAALTVIVLGGAAARLLGSNWGLPLELHPDEPVIVQGALDMVRRHSFEPSVYFRPDHVEIQLSYLAYMAYGHLFHGASPGTLYASDPAPFILMSRLITACFGIAMTVVAYLIGKRFTPAIGVLTAFAVAFFPMYVDHSHLATPDVPLSLTLMIVILGCMRYLDSPSWGNLLLACLGVSVSIAIKYPGALGAIMIAITVIIRAVPDRAWGRLLVHGAGAIGAVVGFLFAISPVLFTNYPVTLSTLRAQSEGTPPLGSQGLGWTGNMGFYAETFASTAGVILLLCFALGVGWCVRLRLVQSIPLGLGAIYWVILSDIPLHWSRWALPMYLTPLLIAPIGAYYSFRYLADKGSAHWLRWAAAGLGAVMATNLLVGSVATTASYLSPDTRTVGREYFAARGVDKTNTVFEGYTPLLPGAPQQIFPAFTFIKGRLLVKSKGAGSPKIRYVVLSSSMKGRFEVDPKYVAQQKFYAILNTQFPLLTTFDPVIHSSSSFGEISNIWNGLDFVRQIAGGGLSGPTIELYENPLGRS
jgi:Dolichyl-phosphate-mannose-protein mannosyltransferase